MKIRFATSLKHPELNSRTVRDIIEHDPEQISEIWCRKIYRHLLQLLEHQYAMQLPHRPITPESVVLDDNGIPLLLATVCDPAPELTKDLTAIARLIHYAITREPSPTAPLRGRALEKYSNSLITAVDRCMAPHLRDRPHTIEELRNILGIVPVGQPLLTETQIRVIHMYAPELYATQAPPRPKFLIEFFTKRYRWTLIAVSAAAVLGIGLEMFSELQSSVFSEQNILTQPQIVHAPQPRMPARGRATITSTPLYSEPNTASRSAAEANNIRTRLGGASSSRTGGQVPIAELKAAAGHTRTSAGSLNTPANPAQIAAAPNAALLPLKRTAFPNTSAQAAQPSRAFGLATEAAVLNLQIQPWGVVYVDGVNRGVSPPMKRLAVVPGRHSIRITNPHSRDRAFDTDISNTGGRIAVDFEDEPQ